MRLLGAATGMHLFMELFFPYIVFIFQALLFVDTPVYLEQVVIHLIQAVNTRSRSELQRLVQEHHAPSLILHRSQLSGVGTVAASDLEAYVDGILSYTTTNNFRMEPHNVTALVDEWKGTAKVFATVTATGTEEAGDTVTNESVLIYYFERFNGGFGGGSKSALGSIPSRSDVRHGHGPNPHKKTVPERLHRENLECPSSKACPPSPWSLRKLERGLHTCGGDFYTSPEIPHSRYSGPRVRIRITSSQTQA